MAINILVDVSEGMSRGFDYINYKGIKYVDDIKVKSLQSDLKDAKLCLERLNAHLEKEAIKPNSTRHSEIVNLLSDLNR